MAEDKVTIFKSTQEFAQESYLEAKDDPSLSFELSELSGYSENGILATVYRYAFVCGWTARGQFIPKKGGDTQ